MAITLAYEHPVTGAVAPTFAQVADQVTLNVIATIDGAETSVITHNFALTAGQLAAGQPEIQLVPLLPAGVLAAWTVPEAQRLTNSIRIDKANVVNSGIANPQLRVNIRRPHSIGR